MAGIARLPHPGRGAAGVAGTGAGRLPVPARGRRTQQDRTEGAVVVAGQGREVRLACGVCDRQRAAQAGGRGPVR